MTSLFFPFGEKRCQASQVPKGLAEGKADPQCLLLGTAQSWSAARGRPRRDPDSVQHGLRTPAHLGLHQLLFYAFGGVLPVLQLLQLTLGPLLGLADILQQLGGLCAGFYSLPGAKEQEKEGQSHSHKKMLVISSMGKVRQY